MVGKAGLLGGEYGSKRGRGGRQWDPDHCPRMGAQGAESVDGRKSELREILEVTLWKALRIPSVWITEKRGGNETYAKNGGKE